MFFWGALAAIAAVITGLLLEESGEYEEEFADPHKWAAITTALFAILLYFIYLTPLQRTIRRVLSIFVLAMTALTGHLGGNVTRGPEFLLEPFNETTSKTITLRPIPNIQQASAFNDVVQPILKEGCYNCHGPKKQKGKLRFDEKEAIVKGGKNGKTVVAGKPEDSELIKRLLLPMDHDDHMPPKNKPQLSRQQISVLEWWVAAGADFNKKVSDLKQPDNIKPVLLALESGVTTPENEITEVPDQPVDAADTAVTEKLFHNGVMIMPVARNSNYLSANFVTAVSAANSLVTQLLPLKKQLISLKLDQSNINDSSLVAISQLSNVRHLQISNTSVSDVGLSHLSTLKELQSLNVVGTSVTTKGLMALKDLKKLKYLYLYKTGVKESEREELKKIFPETSLDFGNYSLPMLVTDTTEVNINK
jgi:hypothetical protein